VAKKKAKRKNPGDGATAVVEQGGSGGKTGPIGSAAVGAPAEAEAYVPAAARRPARVGRRSPFEIYKKGQGYYTRMGTAIGAGVLVLAGAHYLYEKLGVYYDENRIWTLYLRVGVPVAFIAVMGLIIYWVVGLSRRCCDFMIATEGEMKKVSWSTRKEVIGSTKVVIAVVVLLGLMLFLVDLVFLVFFNTIGVLRGPGILKTVFGIG